MRGIISKIALVLVGTLLVGSVALAATFVDVQSKDWFYPYVEALVDVAIIDSAEAYRPADFLNRAEAVKVLVESGNFQIHEPVEPSFDDVAEDAWYYKYVETAHWYGIIGGYRDENGKLTGAFGPSDPVTREQFVKMGVLTHELLLADLELQDVHFSDVPSDSWAFAFIESAHAAKAVNGYADGTFRPKNKINRAEMAKMLYGFLPYEFVGPLCLREGDNLGPDSPDNENECCAGLVSYTPEDVTDTKGICYDPSYVPLSYGPTI